MNFTHHSLQGSALAALGLALHGTAEVAVTGGASLEAAAEALTLLSMQQANTRIPHIPHVQVEWNLNDSHCRHLDLAFSQELVVVIIWFRLEYLHQDALGLLCQSNKAQTLSPFYLAAALTTNLSRTELVSINQA
jgi:hypothetical protein